MFAYCNNNSIQHSDHTGEHYDDLFIENKKARMKKSAQDEQKENTPPITKKDSGTAFFSLEHRVGYADQESHVLFYSKEGYYHVENYTPSWIGLYSFNDQEVGVNIASISLFLGFDNTGVQLGVPYNNSNYAFEATFSWVDCSLRVGGVKTTYIKNGDFIETGGGLEVNLISAVFAAATIYTYINGIPAVPILPEPQPVFQPVM